jgi:MFS family permease
VAQAYIADITSKKRRTSGIGKVGAAHGAGFIIGPAIGGFLSMYGFAAPGLVAACLTLVNLIFVVFFLPESLRNNDSRSVRSISENTFFHKIMEAFKKRVMRDILITLFIVFLSYSAIPVIVPLLGISFFGYGSVEMSYFFMYIGSVHIVSQGWVIGRLAARFGEEKLIIFGPLLMTTGILLMPLYPSIALFIFSLTVMALGSGIMRTIIPSFISHITSDEDQGGALGLANSVASIATVPGPLIGGFLFDYAGLKAPFFSSAFLLIIAFGFGWKIFYARLKHAK